MKQKANQCCFPMRQAVMAVLLFVFFGQVAWAGVADDLTAGKPLQDVIDDNLRRGVAVDALMADLLAAEVQGRDIICGMFEARAEGYKIIAAALNNDMDQTDVVNWSYQCGADRQDIQQGFSMAGETLPADLVFRQTWKIEENAREYLYNPPSPSK